MLPGKPSSRRDEERRWAAAVVQGGLDRASLRLEDGTCVDLPELVVSFTRRGRSGARVWESSAEPGTPAHVFGRFLEGTPCGSVDVVFGSLAAYRVRVGGLALGVALLLGFVLVPVVLIAVLG